MVEEFDDIVLNKKIKEEIESFVKYSKDLKGKTGLIDPFQLVDLISIDDLKKSRIMRKQNIFFNELFLEEPQLKNQ
ncbi:MAG: hypothetical protein ACTSO9_03385 [Candidatus Helarchaeota archaeon]